ncbi:hypothetical protein [Mesorhizobium sp. M0040]|uniref:hypothetical protein n=1 Tax=Mesorhizobium sp. M0040 TaxID=2956855 RepID=UPI00333B6995
MAKTTTNATASAGRQKPRRLTPKPEVLRELYLLSGNQCAMIGCKNVIVDDKGTVIGQVCHIEAAMPDGPRFNENQTNEQRRALSNLVLICANHHLQIDSKKHEADWPLAKVKRLKAEHEAKFKAIPGSLEQRFNSQFADSTDALDPTDPGEFRELEKVLPDCKLDEQQKPKRKKEVKEFLERAAKVPPTERDFMLGVIKRAIKLNGSNEEEVSVHVDDVRSALSVGHHKLTQLGASLERLGVGDVTDVGTSRGDEWHARVWNPSDYLTWFDISNFCSNTGHSLDEFVVHLKFGLLDT